MFLVAVSSSVDCLKAKREVETRAVAAEAAATTALIKTRDAGKKLFDALRR